MEALVGNKKICRYTINRYCANIELNSCDRLTSLEKKEIVEWRMRDLDWREWQRWVPIMGFARVIDDISFKDNLLLNEMHSDKYNGLNVAGNVVSTIVGFGSFLNYL